MPLRALREPVELCCRHICGMWGYRPGVYFPSDHKLVMCFGEFKKQLFDETSYFDCLETKVGISSVFVLVFLVPHREFSTKPGFLNSDVGEYDVSVNVSPGAVPE